jgi:hypothetical protein
VARKHCLDEKGAADKDIPRPAKRRYVEGESK